MRCEIVHKPFLMWDEDMIRKLIGLTLQRGTSGMREEIEAQPENLMTWVVMRNKEPIGWALQIFNNLYPRHPRTSMFYISNKYRRMGIGTKIAKRMENDGYKHFFGWGWNSIAKSFFGSLGGKAR